MSEDEALAILRAHQTRYGGNEGALGELCVRWAARLATFFGGCFFAWLLLHVTLQHRWPVQGRHFKIDLPMISFMISVVPP